MAKHDKGILGPFNGKVGTVVGGSWKGVSYMRSLPSKKKNRRFSEAQQVQQAKFALGIQFLGAFNGLVEKTFQSPSQKTARNIALQLLMREAISGVYPNLSIHYSTVTIAKGSLKKADNAQVASPVAGKLQFSWTDNTGLGNATALDKAVLIAYSPDTNDALFTVEGGDRSSGNSELAVPYFAGKTVHTWLAFRSPDGQLVSLSHYTGMVTVS